MRFSRAARSQLVKDRCLPQTNKQHLEEYLVAGDINVMALVKGEERYVFLFDEDSRAETLRTLGRYASDSELSFSWYDAAVMSQKVRKISSEFAGDSEQEVCQRVDAPLPEEDLDDLSQFPLFDDLPPIDDLLFGDEPIG